MNKLKISLNKNPKLSFHEKRLVLGDLGESIFFRKHDKLSSGRCIKKAESFLKKKDYRQFLIQFGIKKELISRLKRIKQPGIPDFIVIEKDRVYFVEVKNNHRQMNKRQYTNFSKIINLGFDIFVYKIVSDFKIKKLQIRKY